MTRYPFIAVCRLFFLAQLFWLPQAGAQLYKKLAPPGSAFVRLGNGTAIAALNGRIGDRIQPALPPYALGSYVFMPPGPQTVQFSGREQTYPFAADHFYTVAQTADGPRLFDLKGFDSPLKAMVVLYNLLPGTALTLKTSDGETTFFANVESYTAAQREVNPLAVTLTLFKGDKKLSDVPAISFARGKTFSLVAGGTAEVPIVNWDVQE